MKDNDERRYRFDWNHIASMVTLIAATMGFPIYIGTVMNSKLDGMHTKIDGLKTEIDRKFDKLQTELYGKFDNLKSDMDKDLRAFQYEMREHHGRISVCETKIALNDDEID